MATTAVFINEIHYDNSGSDTGEAIEIAGPGGAELTGWSLVLYNGNGGGTYNTINLTGAIPCQDDGFGTVSFAVSGLQNGSPDGIALVNGGAVIQFLSYEGSFTATNGPANGMASTDIGVSESSDTPVGSSLQLSGTGSVYEDFTWVSASPNTFDAPNSGQDFTGGVCVATDPIINEFVANHTGTDTNEFVEVKGDPSTDYSTFSIVEIEGDGTSAGLIDDASFPVGTTNAAGYWDTGFINNLIENGTITLLLVESFVGSVGDDIDTDDDGLIDTAFWSGIVDCIAVTDGGSSDHTYCSTVLAPFFDGMPFGPGGASRIPDGTDTDTDADWVRNDFDGEGLPGFTGTPSFGEAFNTPGAQNAAVPPETPDLVINEIDADQSGTDAAEFVEIFDGGAGNTLLDGLVLVLFNGNGDTSYQAFDLDGRSTDGDGYFVLCGDASNVANCDLDVSPDTNLIQNGADAAALFLGDDTDFPDGTAVTTSGLVDAIVYDTDDSDDAGLLVLLNAGQPQVNERGGGDGSGHSNQRCPNGSGGKRNTVTYAQETPTPGGENACRLPLINEVDADQTSTDDAEFVEIFDGGAGNTSLSGLVVVFFNGNGDTSYQAFDLDGQSTDGDGYFVLCGDAANVANCDLDVTPDSNLIQNGADAVALYIGDATDFPTGTVVATSGLVDAIVYDTDDSDDTGLLVLLNAGQPQVDENGDGAKDTDSNQRCPDFFGGGRNTDTYEQAPPTPGALNDCEPKEIFEIQGSGLVSPFEGFTVKTEDNAVTTLATDGFFMQTPTTRSDGDVDTSDGVFVFTGAAPTVQVGDRVDVSGEIDEFFGLTEFRFGSAVTVVGSGLVPPPVSFDATVPSPDPAAPSCVIEYECYESMLVEVAAGTVAASNQEFGSDPFAEIHVVARSSRAFREPGIEFPGLVGLPVWDGNPEVFELDADKLGLATLNIPAGSTFSAEGVIGFEFNHYELWPSELTVVPAPLPVPVRPRDPGEFTVGTLNLFRLFDDVDDPPDGDRNDQVVSSAEYARRLTKFVVHIVDVLDAPDILAVQEVESLKVLEDLAAAIGLYGDDPVVYSAYLEEGNDIGTIDVGFLVRENIQVDLITQLGKDEIFINPVTGEPNILHDRPPLLLEGSCQLEFGSFPIAVMTVHNRSLGGIDDAVDGPRVRQKRFEQAESIAQKVQDLQSADPGVRLVVIGDFNAFEFTDGYVDAVGIIRGEFEPADNLICQTNTCTDLVEPDLANEVLGLPPEERYSFIFRDTFNPVRSRGDVQVLDHALTSQALAFEISSAEYGRGNADAAEELVEDDGTLAAVELRASDHDGLVVYILKDEDDDGVPNDQDVCPGTVIPEGVPIRRLLRGRWALIDGDGIFDNPRTRLFGFTVGDTAGCSCEQIIEALGLGWGHKRYGCSTSAMRTWVDLVSQ